MVSRRGDGRGAEVNEVVGVSGMSRVKAEEARRLKRGNLCGQSRELGLAFDGTV